MEKFKFNYCGINYDLKSRPDCKRCRQVSSPGWSGSRNLDGTRVHMKPCVRVTEGQLNEQTGPGPNFQDLSETDFIPDRKKLSPLYTEYSNLKRS